MIFMSTPTQRIVTALSKVTGLSFRDMAFMVAGFIAGYIGLQALFIWVVWSIVIIILYRVIKDAFGKQSSEQELPRDS